MAKIFEYREFVRRMLQTEFGKAEPFNEQGESVRRLVEKFEYRSEMCTVFLNHVIKPANLL